MMIVFKILNLSDNFSKSGYSQIRTKRNSNQDISPNETIKKSKQHEVVVLWFVFSNHNKYIYIYSKQSMFN